MGVAKIWKFSENLDITWFSSYIYRNEHRIAFESFSAKIKLKVPSTSDIRIFKFCSIWTPQLLNHNERKSCNPIHVYFLSSQGKVKASESESEKVSEWNWKRPVKKSYAGKPGSCCSFTGTLQGTGPHSITLGKNTIFFNYQFKPNSWDYEGLFYTLLSGCFWNKVVLVFAFQVV